MMSDDLSVNGTCYRACESCCIRWVSSEVSIGTVAIVAALRDVRGAATMTRRPSRWGLVACVAVVVSVLTGCAQRMTEWTRQTIDQAKHQTQQ